MVVYEKGSHEIETKTGQLSKIKVIQLLFLNLHMFLLCIHRITVHARPTWSHTLPKWRATGHLKFSSVAEHVEPSWVLLLQLCCNRERWFFPSTCCSCFAKWRGTESGNVRGYGVGDTEAPVWTMVVLVSHRPPCELWGWWGRDRDFMNIMPIKICCNHQPVFGFFDSEMWWEHLS